MYGNYKRVLDDKKRITIPSKLRKDLDGVIFASLGPDGAIELRSDVSFTDLKDRMMKQSSLNRTMRAYMRTFFGNTFEIEIDKVGRINLSDEILDKANITQSVVFVGVGDKVELWDKTKYDKFESQFSGDDSLDELSAKLHSEGVKI